jgi:hypothetical protein
MIDSNILNEVESYKSNDQEDDENLRVKHDIQRLKNKRGRQCLWKICSWKIDVSQEKKSKN